MKRFLLLALTLATTGCFSLLSRFSPAACRDRTGLVGRHGRSATMLDIAQAELGDSLRCGLADRSHFQEDRPMRSIVRFVPLIALLLGNVAVATAQSADSSHATSQCRGDSSTAGSYSRCALFTDGQGLRQGEPGREVSHVHGLTPLALSQFAMGDSARRYALSYERNAWRGQALRYVAATFITVGLLAAVPPPCQKPHCIGSHPRSVNRPLVGAGLVVDLASLSFRYHAKQARTAALRWHNSRLAQ